MNKPTEKRVYDPKWLARYNKQRKQRYQSDPTYRAHVREANRRSYRNRAIVSNPVVVTASDVSAHGQTRPTLTEAESYSPALCFTVEELGMVLGGLDPSTLYRWITRNILPYPQRTALVHGQPVGVYTLAQVKSVAVILRDHYSKKAYLRKSDSDTITKLFAAVK
jgi:hypothetical protein